MRENTTTTKRKAHFVLSSFSLFIILRSLLNCFMMLVKQEKDVFVELILFCIVINLEHEREEKNEKCGIILMIGEQGLFSCYSRLPAITRFHFHFSPHSLAFIYYT